MAQQQATPSRYRYVIAGLTLALNLSIGLSFFAISPLLPLIVDDYSISRTDAGLLSGLAILIQAVFSIPGGFLAVRLGLKPILAAGWLLAG
ncbi:MAG: MFS transporter, partial [Chloroflexota bacterium]|nr:MFS transporter [Chloroflexota bacterium]